MALKALGFIFGVRALPGNENMVCGRHADTEMISNEYNLGVKFYC